MKKNLFIFISIFVLFFAWNTSFASFNTLPDTYFEGKDFLGWNDTPYNYVFFKEDTMTSTSSCYGRPLYVGYPGNTFYFAYVDGQTYLGNGWCRWRTGNDTAILSSATSYFLNFFSDTSFTPLYSGFSNNQVPDFLNPVPPNTDTRIISVIPESNTTVIPFVATSTDRFANFDVDLLTYYNNPSTSTISIITTFLKNNNIPSYNYTKTQLSGFGTEQATSSYNVAQSVPFGNYDLTITLLNSSLEIISATTSSNITFGSSTNAITFSDIYGASSSNMFDISQIATSSTCGITDLTGCFKNAIIWAFYPTSESLNLYSSFMGSIQEKAPIGYFFTIKNAINGLSTSSESAFVITIPSHLKTYIFNPIDLGIASILWVYFIFMFYKRLKHIQI